MRLVTLHYLIKNEFVCREFMYVLALNRLEITCLKDTRVMFQTLSVC